MAGVGQDTTRHRFLWHSWENLSCLSSACLSSASTSCQIPSGSFLLSGPRPALLFLLLCTHAFLLAVTTFACLFICLWASLVTQMVKNLPAMQETRVRKIPWRRKWQSTPVFLPGKIPWTEEPGGLLQSMGLQTVWHDWAINTFTLLAVFSPLGG